MSHYTGKNFYSTFDGGVIGTDYRSVSVDRSVDTAEVTAGADTDKSYIPTLRDATGSITLVDNGVDSAAIYQALYEGAQGTLSWGPEGTATGKPKYTAVVIITSVSTPIEYNAEVIREYSWQKTGAWVDNYDIDASTW